MDKIILIIIIIVEPAFGLEIDDLSEGHAWLINIW